MALLLTLESAASVTGVAVGRRNETVGPMAAIRNSLAI